jgi:peptidoglycan/LPS O-acetylase OafA/YrhL
LRGVAILLVLVCHFGFLGLGWVGVQLFFVLSGFLISRILIAEQGQPLSRYLARFYWRRSLRIFPAYFGVLAVFLLTYLFFSFPGELGVSWPYLVSYTYNLRFWIDLQAHPGYELGHLWSLSAEEQFYLAWPMIIFFTPRRWLKAFFVFLLLAAPVFRHVIALYFQNQGIEMLKVGKIVYYFTPCQLDAFGAGALVALVGPSPKAFQRWVMVAVIIVLAGYFNQAALHQIAAQPAGSFFGYPLPMIFNYQHIWGYSLLNACAALAIQTLISSNKTHRILESGALTYIGKISYGMYLVFFPIQCVIVPLFSPFELNSWFSFIVFAIYFAAVFLVAHLSYSCYEKRFLKLKERYMVAQQGRER